MADYILLESPESGTTGTKHDRIRIVVHTAIPGSGPNSENEVKVKWRDAIVGWVGSRAEVPGDLTSIVPVSVLPTGVQADLDTGALYEWEFTYVDDANLPKLQRVTNLEIQIADREAAELERVQGILDFYGKTGSV